MSEARIDALAERIARLEGQNARLKWIGGGTSFALLLLIALGAVAEQGEGKRGAAVKALRARGYVAVDGQDRELARLGTEIEPRAGGLMEFLDKAGRRRMVLGLGEDDIPFVSLIDPVRNEQVMLNMEPEKGMALTFRNRKSNSGLVLGIGAEGVPTLGLMGPGGKPLLHLGANAEGSAELILRDKDGKELLQLPAP